MLGAGHLCFFVHAAVEKLDLRELEASYSEEGHPAYHPALLLKLWLYAYALGMTSSRRLEQRIREDLAFRYLAGGAQPDFWALNEFRKRHGRAINDIFTQVVELARSLGLGKLGYVAIDSTRIAANAARSATESREKWRAERAEQRGMRRFRMRGLAKVATEFAMATIALNLTRMWRLRPPGNTPRRKKSNSDMATTSPDKPSSMEIVKPRQNTTVATQTRVLPCSSRLPCQSETTIS